MKNLLIGRYDAPGYLVKFPVKYTNLVGTIDIGDGKKRNVYRSQRDYYLCGDAKKVRYKVLKDLLTYVLELDDYYVGLCKAKSDTDFSDRFARYTSVEMKDAHKNFLDNRIVSIDEFYNDVVPIIRNEREMREKEREERIARLEAQDKDEYIDKFLSQKASFERAIREPNTRYVIESETLMMLIRCLKIKVPIKTRGSLNNGISYIKVEYFPGEDHLKVVQKCGTSSISFSSLDNVVHGVFRGLREFETLPENEQRDLLISNRNHKFY